MDMQEQLARLRDRVDGLMEDYVSPALADACDRLRGHHDTVADHVRARPLTAVLVALGVGFVLGRAR